MVRNAWLQRLMRSRLGRVFLKCSFMVDARRLAEMQLTGRVKSLIVGPEKYSSPAWALIGAALGTIAGIFMGLIGVLFMPFVGAVIGEFIAQKNAKQAAKVGLATWLGLLVGTVIKLVLVFMMIGIFGVALLLTA